MKVCVRKRVALLPDEMRVINVEKAAVDELLWENLMENKSSYFDVDDVSENNIFLMYWNRIGGITYVVLPINYLRNGKKLNFEYIYKKTGITTTSFFGGKRYKRIRITSEIFR